MAYGTVADWFTAVGTVGAFFVALYLLNQERLLRLGAQAAHVSVWAEWKRTVGGQDPTERQYFAYIDNSSDAPVYVDLMQVMREEGDEPGLEIEMGTVPAHDTADYGLDEADFPSSGEPPYVEIFFLDSNRVRWRRDSRAVLEKIGTDKRQ